MDSDDNEDDNDDVEKDNDDDPVDYDDDPVDDDDDDDKAAISVAHWHAPEEIEGSTKERLAVSHDIDDDDGDDDDDDDGNDDNDDVLFKIERFTISLFFDATETTEII